MVGLSPRIAIVVSPGMFLKIDHKMIGITCSLFEPDPVQITIFEVGIYCRYFMVDVKKSLSWQLMQENVLLDLDFMYN